MAITKEQKAALEAAGYTVKGDTVMAKDGGSVAGYNENGKIWSGSDKVYNILKSKPAAKAAAPKAVAKPKKAPAPRAKKEAPVAKNAMTGYKKGDVTTSKIPKGGRGDGAAERIRRMADAAIDRSVKTKAPAKPTTPKGVKPAAGKPQTRDDKKIRPGAALWKALTRGGNPKNYN